MKTLTNTEIAACLIVGLLLGCATIRIINALMPV